MTLKTNANLPLYVLCAIAAVVLLYSLTLMNSPQENRNRKIDENTKTMMHALIRNTLNYYIKNKELPDNQITTASDDTIQITDSGVDYTKISKTRYRICANFLSEQKANPNQQINHWQISCSIYFTQPYPKGKNCYTIEVSEAGQEEKSNCGSHLKHTQKIVEGPK
jgi:hypothetical protein